MSNELQTQTTTGLAVYAILRNSSSQPWNLNTDAYETWVDGHYSQYKIVCTEQGTSGFYTGSVPTEITSAGYLSVEFYTGTGVLGDTFLTGGSFFWDGSSAGDDFSGALTSVAYVKGYIGITVSTYDTFLQNRIYAVSSAIEKYCRNTFTVTNYTEVLDGANSTTLQLKHWPVTAITSVTIGFNSNPSNTDIITTSNLVVNYDTGEVSVSNPYNAFFPYGFQNIQAIYSAGWATIPSDVQEATAIAVSNQYYKMVNKTDPSLLSERIGDYNYTTRGDIQSILTDDIKLLLANYRDIII